MSVFRGSRPIPLGSKEAKNLLSQPGLSVLYHGDTTHRTSTTTDNIPDDVNLDECPSRQQPSVQREGELYCQSCCVSLGDREEQVSHYRLDWHRYNLKRRLKGLTSLTQEDFERLAGKRS